MYRRIVDGPVDPVARDAGCLTLDGIAVEGRLPGRRNRGWDARSARRARVAPLGVAVTTVTLYQYCDTVPIWPHLSSPRPDASSPAVASALWRPVAASWTLLAPCSSSAATWRPPSTPSPSEPTSRPRPSTRPSAPSARSCPSWSTSPSRVAPSPSRSSTSQPSSACATSPTSAPGSACWRHWTLDPRATVGDRCRRRRGGDIRSRDRGPA